MPEPEAGDSAVKTAGEEPKQEDALRDEGKRAIAAERAKRSELEKKLKEYEEERKATMDLPELIMRGLGLHEEKTPEQLEAERRQKFHWNAVPFILTSPLIGFGFGVAGAGVFRLDDDGVRLSKFATNVLYTVKNQVSIPLRTSIYFSVGYWALVGYTNWQIFPAPTWRLGGNTPEENKVIVDKSLVRFWETAFRRVFSDLYVGAGIYFYRLSGAGGEVSRKMVRFE